MRNATSRVRYRAALGSLTRPTNNVFTQGRNTCKGQRMSFRKRRGKRVRERARKPTGYAAKYSELFRPWRHPLYPLLACVNQLLFFQRFKESRAFGEIT